MKQISQEILYKNAIYSLAFLWDFTGLTSIYFSPEIGYVYIANVNRGLIHPNRNLTT
ncbi:hypothetical protein [Pseudoalteromonas sp. NBT06-2]|uniref:hypothetical protein n=1 Tax=Pseudoalteromonas sp. NBT06-2 TaxID=2025950 RepID=UPI001BB09C48|nr:hypothetical protein [Pseudoalteromonas sp. NBT06-2]